MSTTNNGRPVGKSPGQETAGPKRVLLVDDHGVFRELLSVVLAHHAGFGESVQAESLAQARRALDDHESEVDLAVVDLDLPGGSGLKLVEELRGASPGVPVVGVTASPDKELHTRALEAGVSEVLATSASGKEVVATARRLGG